MRRAYREFQMRGVAFAQQLSGTVDVVHADPALAISVKLR
jgi:hypothetical protein